MIDPLRKSQVICMATILSADPAPTKISPLPATDEYVGVHSARLDPDLIRKFSQISTPRFVGHLLLEWALIAASIGLCQWWWNPALYLLTVAWIGARQHGLAVLLHDAAHYRAATNRRLNDFLGILAGGPLFISLHAYRHEHFAHHRHVSTADDPQWVDRDTTNWKFPKTRRALAWLLAKDLIGIGAIETIRYSFRLQNRLRKHGAGKAVRLIGPILSVCIVAAVIASGMLVPFILYWVIPIATWLTMSLRVRSIAEHYALPHDGVLLKTRTVLPSVFDALFIAPNNIAYHIEHHQYPSVPFHQMPRLHKSLMQLETFRQRAHLTHGYFGVFRECLRDANQSPT